MEYKGMMVWIWCFGLLWGFQLDANANDIEIIKDRITSALLSSEVDEAEIERLISTQNKDGTWPGINYEDVSRTGFEHRYHSGNLVTLAKAYAMKGSPYRNDRELLKVIEKALQNWVEEDYFCDNWWHNQIGTPNDLVNLMLLAGRDLPPELVDRAQPMIGRAHLEASGARPSGDRIKIAGILAKNLLFLEDEEQFEEVIQVIEGEIKFSTEARGMQKDYSFHHRVDRVNNTLSYGLGYADAFAEWAVYVAATPYEFSDEKIQHLIDYYLDGISKHMVFGNYPDAGAKNRSIARPGTLNAMGTSTPQQLLKTSDYREDELKEIIRIREGGLENVSRSHSTFFWQSEHFTFQRPHFFTSVRMYSTRNDNMEVPYNSEGLKNHHRGDGTNHIYLTGEEYLDIFPVLDYQKIPGATILQKEALPGEDEIQKSGLTYFVGAVTDGTYGAAVFDFKSPHDPLEAKKSWFFFDNEYVCLGAGITARSQNHVVTTLNQNLLRGKVTIGGLNGTNSIPHGNHELKEVSWLHSDGVSYLFPDVQTVHLSNGPVTGNWTAISKQTRTPKEDVTMDVFKLWVDHGSRPRDATYAYIILPAVDIEKTRNYNLSENLEILSNSEELQAVHHKKLGMTQAIFYQAGNLKLENGLHLRMDGPGALILHHQGKNIEKITASDPSRKLGKLHFSLNAQIEMEEEGIRTLWKEDVGLSEVSIELPKGVNAGKSISFLKP